MSETSEIKIRKAADADADGLVNLIEGCFHEYDGCVMDLDNLDRELLAIETYVNERGGEFWVATQEGRIIGSVGYVPLDPNTIRLIRLYINKGYRRQGLATRLSKLVFDAAEKLGAKAVDCWSDTRFKEAHAYYLGHGYEQLPETRDLNDPSNTTEFHFIKRL